MKTDDFELYVICCYYNPTLTPECCRDLAEGRALLGRAMLAVFVLFCGNIPNTECFICGNIPNTEYRLHGADSELSW